MSLPSPSRAAARWQSVARTVRGAAHVRANMPNQDAVRLSAEGVPHVLAVADGHGSARCKLSDRGSKIAVEVACLCVRELWGQIEASTLAAPALLAWFKKELPARLIHQWRARVDAESAERPTENEANPYLAYGTTLLLAAATPAGVLLAQLGDGDILAVDAAGEVSRPLPGDARLVANETTSLAGDDPAKEMRLAWLRPEAMPALLMLSTDGYSNSCRDEKAFEQVGKDLLRMIVEDGLDTVSQSLEGWLGEVSAEGSGDDVSVGLLYRKDHGGRAAGEVLVPQAPAALPAEPPAAEPEPVPVPTARPAPIQPAAKTPVTKRPGTVLPPATPPAPRPRRRGRGPNLFLLFLVGLAGLCVLAVVLSPLLPAPKAEPSIAQNEQDEKPEKGDTPEVQPPRQTQPEERKPVKPKPEPPPVARAEAWEFGWTPKGFGYVRAVAVKGTTKGCLLAACGKRRFARGEVIGANLKLKEDNSVPVGAIAYLSNGDLAWKPPEVLALAVSKDGRCRLWGYGDGEISERALLHWKNPYGHQVEAWTDYYTLKKVRGPIVALHYGEGELAFCVSNDGGLSVSDLGKLPRDKNGRRSCADNEREFVKLGELACCAIASRGEEWLVVAPERGEGLWYAAGSAKWEQIEVDGEGLSGITCVALSDDAKILATGHADGRVRLWKLDIPRWHAQPKK